MPRAGGGFNAGGGNSRKTGQDAGRSNTRRGDATMRKRMGKRELYERRKDKGIAGSLSKGGSGGAGEGLLSAVLAVGGVFLLFALIFVLVWWVAQADDEDVAERRGR